MLAETEYQHHVEIEIRPFRDVLMGLFFISVGSQFDWSVIVNEPLAVGVLSVGLILGKGLVIMIIAYLAGFEKGVAIRAGVVLGQGSEFGFALLAVALTTGLLDIELSQPIIASIIISMAISPMLIRRNEAFANRFAGEYVSRLRQADYDIEQACKELKNHVILCGFGRTGQNLAIFFKRVNIPFVALEVDTDLITEAWGAGEPVFFGDSSNPDILKRAGIERATALVISFAEVNSSEQIIRTAKQLCDTIPLIVRTRDDRHLERLLECGADEVILDTVESSMMLAQHTLSRLGLDQVSINDLLSDAREGHYARVRAFFHNADEVDLDSPDHNYLHSIEILNNYHAEGRAIESLKSLPKINVIALKRNGVRSDDPLLDVQLKAGDVLIVEGTPDDIQCVEIEVMCGL